MYVADLHIHSKYSRATSRDCDAPHLDLWARRKGIGLVGTGDFTHPAWRAELAEQLVPDEDGLYRLKDAYRLPGGPACGGESPRFVLSGEISTIYKKNGKTRKVHHVILLPDLERAEALSHRLEAIGNLHSDGRPILGLDSHDLLEITLDCCPEAIYIPAHIWTPHFSLFGAFSGFDTLEECYGDLSSQVRALETGLSSDPPMNRRVSALDGYTLVSNSDAHSPAKLGREANVLECGAGYAALKRAVETGRGLRGTIEFFPEEGKYHLDGHRGCQCRLDPADTARLGGRCPVCGRKLTIGVLHRVEELADREEGVMGEGGKPFESLMPLPELLADCMGASPSSKRVQAAYLELLNRLGPELFILRELPVEEAERTAGFAVAEGLRRLRAGRVIRKAGYDGEYGVISLFEPKELELLGGQTSLLELAGLPAGPSRGGRGRKPGPPPAATNPEAAPPEPRAAALNERQREAVEAAERVVAVIAGPGTGKTGTLVERVAYLIEARGISPSRITAVTFTRQAVEEMRRRLEDRLGGKRAVAGLTIGTFHAVCLRLLDQKPVIGQAQALALAGELLLELDLRLSPAEALRRLSAFKNGLGKAEGELPGGFAEAFDDRLRLMGMRDLDGVLLDALKVNVRGKKQFSHLLVDEYQDINAVQRELVRHWSEAGESLFVIGDPDQSIYGFRGADAACFDELLRDAREARTVTLTQNYRSAPAVLENALAVIAHNGGRKRELAPTRPAGAPVRVMSAPDPFSEGVWIAKEIARMAGGVDMLDAQAAGNDRPVTRAFSDIAVLCRTRRRLEQVEACLRHDSIPCVVFGREDFWADAKVRGLLGFFRSLLDPRDALSLREALKALWRCPQPLIQRAETLLGGMEKPEASALADGLYGFEPLRPWLEAVEALLPRLNREKPRKQLERLAGLAGASGPAVERLLNAAVFHDGMAAFLQTLLLGEEGDIRRVSGGGYASGAVRLMTLHAAKGLEFPVVFVAGVNEGDLPLERAGGPVDEEEERRLLFVGMTRSREELVLTCGGEPSPFLAELAPSAARRPVRARNRAPRAEQLSLL